MFVKFSRMLPRLVPAFNATSLYFGMRSLRRIYFPGRVDLSLHEFFHRSGCTALLDSYAAVLQGTGEASAPPTTRWVPNGPIHAAVVESFKPSSVERHYLISADVGNTVILEEVQGPLCKVTVLDSGIRGRLPTRCIAQSNVTAHPGGWRVAYVMPLPRVIFCNILAGMTRLPPPTPRRAAAATAVSAAIRPAQRPCACAAAG